MAHEGSFSPTCSSYRWGSRCCRGISRSAGCQRRCRAFLTNDWRRLVLLVVVAVISSVLDNIAAALIGSPIPRHRRDLQCRGSGSVVGDPTTMMRIDGVSPLSVLAALVAASVPLVVFGFPATIQQRRYLRSSRMRRPGRESNRRECSSSPSSRLQRSPPTSLPTYAFLPEAKSAGHCYGMAGTSPWLISSGSSSCCRCSVGIPTRHTGNPL